jgi:lipopolysaccharide assembly protein A
MKTGKIMRYIGYIIILVVVLIGISFAVMNANSVPVNYYTGQQHVPLSLLLALSFGVGVIIGIAVLFFKNTRLRLKNRWLSKRLKKTEKKLNALRATLEESTD